MKNLIILPFLTVLVLFTSINQADACFPTPISWNGSESSDWNDPDNYSKGRLPNTTWDTRLDIDATVYTNAPVIAADATFTAPPVRLSNGASLTVNANASAGSMEIQGGTTSVVMGAGGILSVSGDLNFSLPGTSNISGTGAINVSGDVLLSSSNVTLNNTSNIDISGDLRTSGVAANINVNNNAGGIMDIGGDVNFNGAVNDIINSGRLILQGSFQGINIAGTIENTSSGEWYWSYNGGSWDVDILSAFTDNGTFVYSASSSQSIIPLSYNNLRIEGTGTKTLTNDVTVNNTLTLSNGNIGLGDFNLVIPSTGTIAGGSNTSFIITDGAGSLIQQNIGAAGRTGDVLFPVGFSSTSYTPLTINNTSGVADDFSVRLEDAIYADGYSGTEQTTDMVDRTWFIDEATPGGSDVTLTFQWSDAEGLTGFNAGDMHIIHYDGAQWEQLWSGAATGTGPYVASVSGVSDFSPFGLEGSASPLPVELINFNANFDNDEVVLSWATASELNNDYFILEKSVDLDTFIEVAVVSGNGTTNESISYNEVDSNPFGGISYYRLTQVDYDGTSKVYPPVKVAVPLSGMITTRVYPNPSNGESISINLAGFDKSLLAQLEVINVRGEVLYQEDIVLDKGSAFQKDISFDNPLVQGVYLLKVNTPDPIVKRILVR